MFTDQARSAYQDRAEYVDVKRNDERLEEMLRYSNGVRKVPVIVDGDQVKIGYGGT